VTIVVYSTICHERFGPDKLRFFHGGNMHTEPFKASVQYGDLKGTAAADRADKGDAEKWLKEQKLSQDGEYLLGIELWVGENHGAHKDPVSVTFLLAALGDHDSLKTMIESHNGPIVVRKVTQSMPIAQFLGFFKRFSVSISVSAMPEDREVIYY
jgi:hypothetical protein